MIQKLSTFIFPGKVLRLLSQREADQLAKEWLGIFGENRHCANAKAFLWHIFSNLRYPCTPGKKAIQYYAQQVAAEVIILSNDRKLAFVTDLIPRAFLLDDYYVFPLNLAWTMAFTHDGSCYFARHKDFDRLDAENRYQVEKCRKKEAARLKGWA